MLDSPKARQAPLTASKRLQFVTELTVSLFPSTSRATLANQVSHVVGLGADKQVIGANTGRIVAVVTHEQALFDWPIRQFI